MHAPFLLHIPYSEEVYKYAMMWIKAIVVARGGNKYTHYFSKSKNLSGSLLVDILPRKNHTTGFLRSCSYPISIVHLQPYVPTHFPLPPLFFPLPSALNPICYV